MDSALLCCHKPGAHVNPACSQCQGGYKAAPVAKASRGDDRNLHSVGSQWNQDEGGNILLTGCTGALETINTDGIAPYALSGASEANGGALVYHLHSGPLEPLHVLLWASSCCLHNPRSGIDDGAYVTVNVHRTKGGQQCYVHSKGLVRKRSGLLDLSR